MSIDPTGGGMHHELCACPACRLGDTWTPEERRAREAANLPIATCQDAIDAGYKGGPLDLGTFARWQASEKETEAFKATVGSLKGRLASLGQQAGEASAPISHTTGQLGKPAPRWRRWRLQVDRVRGILFLLGLSLYDVELDQRAVMVYLLRWRFKAWREGEPRFTWHWQDLSTYDEHSRHWRDGRMWFNWKQVGPRDGYVLRLEWNVWHSGLGAGVQWGNFDDDVLSLSLRCGLFAIFVGLTWPGSLARWCQESLAREINVSAHDGAIWWEIGCLQHEWNSGTPRWQSGNFQWRDWLLSPVVVARYPVFSGVRVFVPMPEGRYPALLSCERVSRYRPRLRALRSLSVGLMMQDMFAHYYGEYIYTLDIPNGIPHAGKGENGWDCGDDGLHGISGDSADGVIQRAIDTVMQRRRQYGAPSGEAVRKALGLSTFHP